MSVAVTSPEPASASWRWMRVSCQTRLPGWPPLPDRQPAPASGVHQACLGQVSGQASALEWVEGVPAGQHGVVDIDDLTEQLAGGGAEPRVGGDGQEVHLLGEQVFVQPGLVTVPEAVGIRPVLSGSYWGTRQGV